MRAVFHTNVSVKESLGPWDRHLQDGVFHPPGLGPSVRDVKGAGHAFQEKEGVAGEDGGGRADSTSFTLITSAAGMMRSRMRSKSRRGMPARLRGSARHAALSAQRQGAEREVFQAGAVHEPFDEDDDGVGASLAQRQVVKLHIVAALEKALQLGKQVACRRMRGRSVRRGIVRSVPCSASHKPTHP